MNSVDDFSRLVSGIYAAVVTPARWDAAMADIGAAFDGAGAALVVTDASTRTLVHTDMAADAATSYAEHFCRLDHVLAAVEAGPVGAMRTGEELIWPRPNCEFTADWASPNGFGDGLFIRLTAQPLTTSLAIASEKRAQPFDTAERVALAQLLVPHLQRASTMQRDMQDVSDRTGDLLAAADAVNHGLVILAAAGRAVFTNAAADRVLRSNDGLRISAGILAAGRPAVDAQLRQCIRRVLEPDDDDVWGGSFLCARPSGRRPYVVHVLPADQATTTELHSARAVVVIVDPERHTEPPAALLGRLFGLTRSEAQVALLVIRGGGLAPIADELSLSLTTVKTHLKHVFEKTDTHRQAELVRLLLTIDPLSR